MSLSRRNAKRDLSERPIIDALEPVGCRVWQISGEGKPDLLTLYRRKWLPLAVKTPKIGRLTKKEKVELPWPLVRTPEDALLAIGCMKSLQPVRREDSR